MTDDFLQESPVTVFPDYSATLKIKVAAIFELPVCEVRTSFQDERDWLAQVIKYVENGDELSTDIAVQVSFSKSSVCGIVGCKGMVETGKLMTCGGSPSVLIVPCCKYHSEEGVLDDLGFLSRLKLHQVYAAIYLEDDFIFQDEDGIFHLAKPLPSLVLSQ